MARNEDRDCICETLQCAFEEAVLCKFSDKLSQKCRETAIFHFIERDENNRDILEILIKDINMKLNGFSLLDIAIMKDRVDLVEMLLKKGINVNPPHRRRQENEHGFCSSYIGSVRSVPLFKAIESGNIDILKLLISHGANVNILFEHVSPLLHALTVDNPCFDGVKELLFAGSWIKSNDFLEAFALDLISRECKFTSLLIDYGMNHRECLTIYRAEKESDPDINIMNFLCDLKPRDKTFTREDFSFLNEADISILFDENI